MSLLDTPVPLQDEGSADLSRNSSANESILETMSDFDVIGCPLHATQDDAYGFSPPAKNVSDDVMSVISGKEEAFEGFDDPPIDGRFTDDGRPYAWLHGNFTFKGTPLTSSFMESGGAMNTVVFAGTIDLAVSGCKASSVVSLKSDTVTNPTDDESSSSDKREAIGDTMGKESVGTLSTVQQARANYQVAIAMPDAVEDGVVTIDPGLMILALLNVGALCTSGCNGEVHGGFGYDSLLKTLQKKEAMLPIQYGRWKPLQNVVTLTNVHLREGSDRNSKLVNWKVGKTLQPPPGVEEIGPKQIAAAFVKMVTQANETRGKKLVYPLLPGLTKIFAAVPVAGYAPVEALLHTPTSLSAEQLEHFMRAMIGVAVQQDDEQIQKMREETARPPPLGTASPWRHIAARAIHLATRMSTDYREDGAVTLDGNNQPTMVPLESFLPHAVRSIFDETNDCDGSTLEAIRTARQIGLSPFGDDRYRASDGKFISLDPGYDDTRHWATRGIRNALSHTHAIVFNIVGASSGEGAKVVDKNTGQAKVQVAGHAVPVFLPVSSTLDAMDAGEYERAEVDRASIAAARARVFFPEGKLRAAASSEQLQTILSSPNAEIAAVGLSKLRKQHLGDLKREGLVPFAIDGTITSEMDMHAHESEAKTRAQQARSTLQGFARLGPNIADRVVDLTALGPKNTNAFYHDLVESVIAGHIGDDPELVELNAAAHNFVYANVDAVRERKGDVIDIGASAANVHTGEMAMIPLVRLDAKDVVMHNAMRQMVRLHSMPPRRPEATHRANSEVTNAQTSTDILHELGQRLAKRVDSDDRYVSSPTYLEMYISPRAMWRNPNAIKHLIERIDIVARRGQVDLIDLKDVQKNAVAAVIAIEV